MPWSGATSSLSLVEGGRQKEEVTCSLTPFLFGHVDFALSLADPDGGNSRGSRVANQACTDPSNTRNKSQLDINLHFLIR